MIKLQYAIQKKKASGMLELKVSLQIVSSPHPYLYKAANLGPQQNDLPRSQIPLVTEQYPGI